LNIPQPVQHGGPRILVGGGGEKKTLRLVARYADMWNGFGDEATIRHKLEVLRRHCDDVGRDPSEILTTRLGTLIVAETTDEAERRMRTWQRDKGVDETGLAARLTWGDVEGVRTRARSLLDTGLGGLIFNMPGGSTPDQVRLAGEALGGLR
jgi:alkanesulfonate monooxygenase SsuD/methylene tetrahydromethanopterin reductase-like flavin-dependent oxidoreductase (luciferase family)